MLDSYLNNPIEWCGQMQYLKMNDNIKDSKEKPNLIIELAHIFNRVYLQKLSHILFLSILLIFQCSIQLCVLNRFLQSNHQELYLKIMVNKLYSCSLLTANAQFSSYLTTNLVRISLSTLLLFNIIFILSLKKGYKGETCNIKNVRNISKTTFTLQLLLNIPFAYFSSYQIFNKNFQILNVLDYMNLGLIVLSIYCFQKISIQAEYDSRGSVLSTYNQNNPSIKIIKTMIACLFVRQVQYSVSYMIFLYFVLLGINFTEIRYILDYRRYINHIYQRITQISASINITNSFLILLFTPLKLELIQHNVGVIFVIVAILFYYSLKGYVKSKRTKLFLDGCDSIRVENIAISYILQLIKIDQIQEFDMDNQKNLFITMILEDHTHHCKKVNCLCRSPQKEHNKHDLIKQIIMNFMRALCEKFSNSLSLKLIQIGYKITHSPKIISLNLQIQSVIKFVETKDVSFQSKFILEELTYKIQSKCNKYKFMNKLKCQNVFLQESIKSEVSQLIIDLINITVQKYKLLSLDFYNLNSIEQHCRRINKLIREIEELWEKVGKINSFNFQIYQIFIFYYKNVVTSRIEAKHMAEEINSKLQKISLLKKICRESANKYIYSKKTCIVQSHIQESFGLITNITTNCNEILGAGKQHLLGKNINQVMWDYFAKGHQQAMANWLQNCVDSSSHQEMVQFGFVDLRYYCFQGYLFMKVLSNGQKLLFYSMLIRQNDEDYFLLNSDMQIQGVGKRFLKQQILNMNQIKHYISQYSDLNKDCMNNETLKTKILFQKDISKIQQSCKSIPRRSFQKSHLKYQCDVTITKYTIGKKPYYLIKLNSISKWLSATSFKEINIVEVDPSNRNMRRSIDNGEDLLLQDDYQSSHSFNPARYSRINKLSIQNSSMSDDSREIYSYNNFIFNVKKYLIHPQLIPSTFYKQNLAFVIFICIIVVTQIFSLRTVFVVGFKSFNDVMFGDGAVSDNNQILQMLYNNVLMSQSYCPVEQTSQRCEYIINSTVFISNILYGLYVSDLEVYLVNKTSLSKLKFYQSYDIPVKFTVGNTTQQISTLQFMEYYYYAIYEHNAIISAEKKVTKKASEIMSILLDNWQPMKFINHNAIYFYLSAGEKELNMLNGYLLLLVGGILTFVVILGLGLNKYYDYLDGKKRGILSIYEQIHMQLGKDMGAHYETLKEFIVTGQFPLIVVPKLEEDDHHYRKKKVKYQRSKLYLVQIIAILLILMLFCGIQFLQVSLIIPPSRSMVQIINNLMDSQNYLLEAYFQLKTYYLQQNFSKSVEQISQELSTILNSSEPYFTSMAKNSLTIFSNDPTFTANFNDFLVLDVCNLTSPLFQRWQVSYCYQHLDPLVTSGLMNSMTYFYRNSFEALNQLKRRQYQNINKTEYFKQQVFEDIDDSLFYMFRLYQATQARMYQGLNYIVNNSLFLLDLLNVLSTLILVAIIVWWLFHFKHQQRQLSHLYGMVMQFPQVIMKKTVISIIKEELQIKI